MHGKGIVVRTRYNRARAVERRPRLSRRAVLSIGIAAVALSGALVSAFIVSGSGGISLTANSSRSHHGHDPHGWNGWTGSRSTRMMFSTLDNRNDHTFNQLLGINNRGVIAGYFGSGPQNHPEQGLPAADLASLVELLEPELPAIDPDAGHRPQ